MSLALYFERVRSNEVLGDILGNRTGQHLEEINHFVVVVEKEDHEAGMDLALPLIHRNARVVGTQESQNMSLCDLAGPQGSANEVLLAPRFGFFSFLASMLLPRLSDHWSSPKKEARH
jgi:hypothetical protein